MPASLQYQWEQTEEHIIVRVSLQGVNKKKLDIQGLFFIFCNIQVTPCFIKANAPPFLFELDLYEYIEPEASKSTISEKHLEFVLHKVLLFCSNVCLENQCVVDKRKISSFFKARIARTKNAIH